MFGDNPALPETPLDPKLQHYMGGVFTFTHYFLFLHELCHVIGGHVEHSAEIRRESHAIPRDQREAFLKEHLEPLEFIADGVSHLLVGALVNTLAAGSRRKPDPSIKTDVLDWLTLTGFGIGTLFLLLETFDIAGGPHPPAAQRATFLRAYSIGPKGRQPGFEHVSFEDGTMAIDSGFQEAIAAWDALGWKRERATSCSPDLVERVKLTESKLTKPNCLR